MPAPTDNARLVATPVKFAKVARPKQRFYREVESHLSADLKALAKAKDGRGLRAALEGHMHFLLRHPDAIPSED